MYKPGQSGNPRGRAKGIGNKKTEALREAIQTILDNNIDRVQEDLEQLEPKDRLMFLDKLLAYALPKMQSILQSVSIESLPEEQLDQIISQLSENL